MTLARPAGARKVQPRSGVSKGIHLPLSPQSLRRILLWVVAGLGLVVGILLVLALRLPERARLALAAATASTGLEVRNVTVTGTKHISRNAVLDAAFGDEHTSAILAMDLPATRARLEALPWVQTASVARRLPDRIEITIRERTPAAIWQQDRRRVVIDATGHVLSPADPSAFAGLPHIVGPGANLEMASLGALLATQPLIARQVATARWIGERRWDLQMASGELLLLPEGYGAAQRALAEFARLDATRPLLGQGYQRFDLRLPEKMVVRMNGAPVVAVPGGTEI